MAYATDAMVSVDEIRYCAMGIRCERYDTRTHKSEEMFVKKRLLYLVGAAVVVMLILVPGAFAQGTMEQKMEMETTVLQPTGGGAVGGPAVILPAAAALLMGAGVLTYAMVRRHR